MSLDYITRKELLTNICLARKEYFRLKEELSWIPPRLEPGTCIGNYWSKCIPGEYTRYQYHALSHKDAVLPSAKDENKLTRKRHIGRDHNPNYREALILIEETRVRQIKLETLSHITTHLNALKNLYKAAKTLDTWDKETKRLMSEFLESTQKESIFEFIKKQREAYVNSLPIIYVNI